MTANFQNVAPPANYRVERLSFQRWALYSPANELLSVHQFQHYAANRAHRHFAKLAW